MSNSHHVPRSVASAPGARRGPVARVALTLAALLGALVGLGTFTFVYGEGASYFVDDPASCANCHVMQGHYDSWLAASHREVATCNDCHLRHHPLGKWLTKADNGFCHSFAFTTGVFPDPIRIKARNRRVTQAACIHCHADFFHAAAQIDPDDGSLLCVHCHAGVGHAHR